MSPYPNFERAEYENRTHPVVLDASEIPDAPATPDSTLLARAILFGIAGAVAGAIIDALFIGLTHINLGYLAILIAYLVAKGITFGSKGQGGRAYQISALILTYLSISAAHSTLGWWQDRQLGEFVQWTPHYIATLAEYGIAYPLIAFRQYGASALIGLFILFIGMRAAWRMTSGIPGAVRHPFAR